MLTRCVSVCLLGLLAGVTTASAQVPPETTRVELGFATWSPEPTINLQNIDFSGTLGIEAKRLTDYRVRAGGAHKFRFSYLPIAYDDSKVIQTSITFQGVTYPVTVPVTYELEWKLYRIGYEWDFVRFNYGFVGLVAEVKYNKVLATLSAPSVGAEATEANVPVPTIGGIARGYLGQYLSVTGEFTGLKLTRDEFRGRFYDLDIYAQLNLVKQLAIQAGYRSLDVDYLADGDNGTLTFDGPYLGGVIRF